MCNLDALVLVQRLQRAAVPHGDDRAAGQPLAYELAPEDPLLGSALTVRLPPGTRRVAVAYEPFGYSGAMADCGAKATLPPWSSTVVTNGSDV